MAVIELVVVLAAAVPGAIVLLVARRRGWLLSAVERPPLPVRAAVIAAAAMILGAIAGLALGGEPLERFLRSSLPEAARIVTTGPADALAARLRMGAVPAAWLALPGAAALGWLARSRDRSPRAAALFGAFVALGFGAGAAHGLALAPAAVATLTTQLEPLAHLEQVEAMITLGEAAAIYANASLGLGLAGALLTGSAAAASRSAAAFAAALAISGAMVPAILLLSALLTPPDLLSQLALAFVLVASWVVGLVIAGAIVALRRRARDGAPRRF
ncbi:MAG: twin-arginine translocase subunit TatC [Sandaracinaceae bacterium]|nr:twin-arginine translocase subunit TatC [Sandaracinaceae bacterium]